jgi:hypothetical protein
MRTYKALSASEMRTYKALSASEMRTYEEMRTYKRLSASEMRILANGVRSEIPILQKTSSLGQEITIASTQGGHHEHKTQ